MQPVKKQLGLLLHRHGEEKDEDEGEKRTKLKV